MSTGPLFNPHFPRSNKYNPQWLIESAGGGANALWLIEWLTSALQIKPGMRILDLGCGRAVSSIFLAREFDVTVWAADLWFSPDENFQRISDAGLDRQVFPIQCDARRLPFATEYFDAIISIDAFPYFGTDDHYLHYLARFVKPNGTLSIACAGFTHEIDTEVPGHLAEWLRAEPLLRSMHSTPWWRNHWEKSGVVDIELADTMQDGWMRWLEWHQAIAPDNQLEIKTLEADRGQYLSYNRVIGRRRSIRIEDPVVSIPPNYSKQPLLKGY